MPRISLEWSTETRPRYTGAAQERDFGSSKSPSKLTLYFPRAESRFRIEAWTGIPIKPGPVSSSVLFALLSARLAAEGCGGGPP